jgi:hypothetical protein
VGWLAEWPVEWLAEWPVEWPVEWLAEWPVEWLAVPLRRLVPGPGTVSHRPLEAVCNFRSERLLH